MKKQIGPKILVLDIETAPLVSYSWGIWDQNIALNQIKEDWSVLSWAAKWIGNSPSRVMYQDQRNSKDVRDDKKLLEGIWKLLDEADIILTQNGKAFDIKKLNARFIQHGFKPYSSVKHIDTKQIASHKFGFTSNKLEYLTDKLCVKYKKLKHNRFSGFELWKECLNGNKKAWDEMKKYNIYDILSLEELYMKLRPWDNSLNPNLYTDNNETICSCGSNNFKKNGYAYTSMGKFQRFACSDCGAEIRSRDNLFSKEKRKSLKA